jgi:antitoxin HigA-1
MPPVHPGEHLADFLDDYQLTQYGLAKALRVSPRRINQILHGDRRISLDTALRLARYFGTTAQLWLNLQNHYDLECAARHLSRRIDREVKPRTDIPREVA